jgi:arylsulfate sulfotransferase
MFIRNGHDWFHMNSAIYYEKDNSLIVSSRENFVIAIDYDTSKIKWLLGDETKYWYVNFPSLRNLSLSSSDVKPIGQHSLSMVDRGLLLFNNGQASFQQPDGEPVGQVLETSAASIYEIDEEAKSALLIWDYNAGIYSDICSSVYEFNQSDEYLITYTAAGRLDKDEPYYAYIQSIDHSGSLLFELILSQANQYCATAFQAAPLTLN